VLLTSSISLAYIHVESPFSHYLSPSSIFITIFPPKSSFFTTKIPGQQGALAWREACSESWSSAEVPGRRQIHGE